MLYAIGYGFLTLVSVWAGGGAQPALIAQRALWGAFLLLAAAIAITKLERPARPLRWSLKPDTNAKPIYAAASIGLIGGIGFFAALKTFAPAYFSIQSIALTQLSPATGSLFMMGIAISGFCYQRFFGGAWGPKSSAFLEALTWGIAIQSCPAFVWIFLSGWLFSRFTNANSALVSALIRLLVGLAWIYLL